jgi:hypothetical protein
LISNHFTVLAQHPTEGRTTKNDSNAIQTFTLFIDLFMLRAIDVNDLSKKGNIIYELAKISINFEKA